MTYAEKPHILVVDDDDRIRELLSRYLTQQGFVIATAGAAAPALDMLAALSFDLIILDVMMPGMTGIEMAKKLRASQVDIPVLLLTARGEVDDRISGFESGADDYVVKPFEPRELKLRIEAILRRRPAPDTQKSKFRLGPWNIDLDQEEIKNGDSAPEKLTPVEIKLLRALSARAGDVMSRDELARMCGVNPDERTIDVQITRLRRRLDDDPSMPRYIMTVRGQGYRLMTQNMEIG